MRKYSCSSSALLHLFHSLMGSAFPVILHEHGDRASALLHSHISSPEWHLLEIRHYFRGNSQQTQGSASKAPVCNISISYVDIMRLSTLLL